MKVARFSTPNLHHKLQHMKKIIVACMLCMAFCFAYSQNLTYFSPLNAIPVGASGPSSSTITAKSYCCPSTAIEITGTATEAANQWILIPLNGIPGSNFKSIDVCYQVVGRTSYISQVRLTEMTVPNAAHVRLDDGTDRNSTTPVCIGVKGSFPIKGTITLALKVVIGQGEKILVGGVSVLTN